MKNLFQGISKKLLIAICLCVAIAGVSVVLAVAPSFMFHQTLTVPPIASFAVYRGDGVTLMASMDDVSTQWHWTSTQAILSVWIKNTGTSAITPQFAFSSGTLNGWTFTVGGNATITAGMGENCSITAFPPSPITAGNSTGDFDITVTAS